MPRYIKQRTRYDCAPITLINAMKWAGCVNVGHKDIEIMRCLTNHVPGQGSCPEELHKGLTSCPFLEIEDVREAPSAQEVNAHLCSGGAIVAQSGIHFYLITDEREVINHPKVKSVSKRFLQNELAKLQKEKPNTWDRVWWFLRKAD